MKINVLKEYAKRDVAFCFGNMDIPKRYIKLIEQVHVIEQQLHYYRFQSAMYAHKLRNELMNEVKDSCKTTQKEWQRCYEMD